MSKDINIDELVNTIRQSSKYKKSNICAATIRDLIETELPRHKHKNEAIQAAKKKLHRIVAPYLGDPDYNQAIQQLESAIATGGQEQLKATCTEIMASHLSTRERQPLLNNFYRKIFAHTGTPNSILDIACALHPLSFPWMELPIATRYYAYDLHQTRVEFLNQYFTLQGLEPLAIAQDILVNFPNQSADLAFIFKEVHRFEQRQRGCTLPLLDALQVRYLLISLPTTSASGKWDVTDRYRDLVYGMISDRPWQTKEIEFATELIFIIDKQA
ncbi:ribosomal RNA methyltransferase [Thalassoporum mexicanum PCC 7367]|uniref:16S rRNA methyltransferase n=1 Tax=Thalassoporum mexicanum TaxID=3457544 RepID=UPI00029FEDEB|nr:16S rRNA methyltransferase [Pseudanabaena sp. PCC 7367]AFY69325.1 ribosomal RNA methyltransferase [Pseudanabaena sp. PCC 7367]